MRVAAPAEVSLVIIINADDWGRSREETDRAAAGCLKGRVTSVSAMVFMKDSERAAELAKQHNLDVGLHLNFGENFTGSGMSEPLARQQAGIVRFLELGRYALVLYNPFLRKSFQHVYQAQMDEFLRLYGRPPTHLDGHKHYHLCSNLLIGHILPSGLKVRRGFTFFAGEKGALKLAYRKMVDRALARRFILTDFFFSLTSVLKGRQMERVTELAKHSCVELMTHPCYDLEYDFLMGDSFTETFRGVKLRGFGPANLNN